MNLYILRHAHAIHNLKKILDENPKNRTFLTKKGILQAKRKSSLLSKIPIDIIFSSKFPRAIQTAKILNIPHKVKIILDKRLNERKTGIDRQPCKKWRSLIRKDRFHFKLPGGESFQDEKSRLKSFLKFLKKNHKKYKNVIIVTHGEPVQILNGLIKNYSDKKMYHTIVRNAQVFIFKNH